MKKNGQAPKIEQNRKRLSLNRETLRQLSTEEMERAAGGTVTGFCSAYCETHRCPHGTSGCPM